MKKTDITIDVMNVEKIQEILRHAYESAEKYCNAFWNWWTWSETYSDMRKLMNLIEWQKKEKNIYIIQVEDENSITTEVDWNDERVFECVLKNIDVIKSIVAEVCKNRNIPYEPAIQELAKEIQEPLKWKKIW